MAARRSEHPRPAASRRWGWFRVLCRWLRPSVLTLGLVFFALPFLTVACDTPGGFGHVSPGGTTSWTGYDLALGSAPERSAEHVLPAAEAAPDVLPVQPLVLIALVLQAATVVCALVITTPQWRRYVSVCLAALTGTVLTSGLLVARDRVITLLTEQLAGRTLPPDRTPASYVVVGSGFTWTVAVLCVVLVTDLFWWIRGQLSGRRARRARSG